MAPIRKISAIPSSNKEERNKYDRDEKYNHENTDSEESDDEHVEQSEDDSDDEDREVAAQSTPSKISKPSSGMDDSVVLSQAKPSQTVSDSDSGTYSDSSSDSGSYSDSDSDSILMEKNPTSLALKTTGEVESVKKKSVKPDPGVPEKSHNKKRIETPQDPSHKKRIEAPQDALHNKKRIATPQDTPHQSKKSRKEKENGPVEFKDAKKQNPFQRVWSNNDEIALLRGMIAYASEKGDDPSSHVGKFLDYINNSLHFQVKKSQLDNKIRSLRKKFEEKAVKVKTGEKLRSPHDQEVFDLSSRIWSNHGSPVTPQIKGSQEKEKEKILGVDEGLQVERAEKLAEKETSGESLALDEMIKYYKCSGYDSCEEFLRCGMGNLDQTERLELEEAWKRINIMKSEVVLHMVKLVQRNIEAVLKATKK